MPQVVSADELAGRIRQEHQTLRGITRVLQEHIAARMDNCLKPWLEGLKLAFGRLTVHVERIFETQEAGGYFDALSAGNPKLSPRLAQMRNEHAELLRTTQTVQTELNGTCPDDLGRVADVCAHVQNFIESLWQHEEREQELAAGADDGRA